jgi:DUF1009 family protein
MSHDRLGFPDTIGVLAGRGDYPTLLVERLIARERRVFVAGIGEQFSGRAPAGCAGYEAIPLGAIGAVARFFRHNGVTLAFMAGGVRRRGAWRSVRPDLRGLRLVPQALLVGDDGLLRAVADELGRLGVEIGDPTALIADLLAGDGPIAGPEVGADAESAWELAATGEPARSGQAAVVYRGRVVGREDWDGTDALLARAPGPGAVLVKRARPGQDRRFDMPAIGPSTVIAASAVGVSAIAVEAGAVLLLRKGRVLELCEELGVSLIGLSAFAP